MLQVIENNMSRQIISAAPGQAYNTGGLVFFGIMIMLVGIISIAYPQLFWHLRVGRKLPDLPPSSLYLLFLRFGGILALILGLIMILGIGINGV